MYFNLDNSGDLCLNRNLVKQSINFKTLSGKISKELGLISNAEDMFESIREFVTYFENIGKAIISNKIKVAKDEESKLQKEQAAKEFKRKVLIISGCVVGVVMIFVIIWLLFFNTNSENTEILLNDEQITKIDVQ